jgi:heat shock protein HslJ
MHSKSSKVFGYIILLGLIGLVVSKLLSPTDELDGTSWKLTEMAGSVPVQGSIITAKFSGGKVGGSSGCNTYSGNYKVKGSTLQISDVAGTEMACLAAGVMDQEQVYFGYLAKAASYEWSETQLTINAADNVKLIFVSVQ